MALKREYRYGGMTRFYPPDRVAINKWVREPGYKAGRDFRIKKMSEAFGLSEVYLREYCAGLASMGPCLAAEILGWTRDHPDLSHNNPETYQTHFASLKLD